METRNNFSWLVLSNVSAQKEQMLAEKQSFFLSRICFSELQEKQSEKQKLFIAPIRSRAKQSLFYTRVIQEVWGLHLAQARLLYLLFLT